MLKFENELLLTDLRDSILRIAKSKIAVTYNIVSNRMLMHDMLTLGSIII